MPRSSTLNAVVSIAIGLAGCSSSTEPTRASVHADAFEIAPSAIALPLASTTASAASPSRHAPHAPPKADPSAPMPHAYAAFGDEMAKRCPYDSTADTDAAMARAETDVLNCGARILEADAKKLPKGAWGALLQADPSAPIVAASKPTLWSLAIDDACYIEGVQSFVQGSMSLYGTMNVLREVSCLERPDLSLGFIMRMWSAGKPEDVALYVRASAKTRPAPRQRLALWLRYAELARVTAPLSVERDPTYMHRMNDADWLAVAVAIHRTEDGARKEAAAVCAAWPALAKAFGKAGACEDELGELWLPSEWEMGGGDVATNDPAPDAKADDAEPKLPPPADAGMDRATLPLRREWAEHASSNAGALKFYDDAIHAPTVIAMPKLARLLPRVATFTDRLTVANGAATSMQFTSDASAWVASSASHTAPTARFIEGYAVNLIGQADAAGLAAHVQGRTTWGGDSEKNLKAARAVYANPCKPASFRDCAAAKPSDFKNAAERIEWLLQESDALARDLCAASPALESALGQADCAPSMKLYLLSLNDSLGKPDMLDGW